MEVKFASLVIRIVLFVIVKLGFVNNVALDMLHLPKIVLFVLMGHIRQVINLANFVIVIVTVVIVRRESVLNVMRDMPLM